MTADCLIFVGSLNREAPYFQGARGVGLSVYALRRGDRRDRIARRDHDIDNPTLSLGDAGRLAHLCQLRDLRLA